MYLCSFKPQFSHVCKWFNYLPTSHGVPGSSKGLQCREALRPALCYTTAEGSGS